MNRDTQTRKAFDSRRWLRSLSVALWLLAPIAALANNCNRPTHDPLVHVRLPGAPFTALPSADGCWIFVSLSTGEFGSYPGVALLSRADGVVAVERVIPLRGEPTGMVLTHDGKLLIVPNGSGVAFVDVQRLIRGEARAVLGYWGLGRETLQRIYASVTSDDRYLFVSNEGAGSLSVVDLAAARRSRFMNDPLVATLAIGTAPLGLAFSSDERYLFATVQSVETQGWPRSCRPETDPLAAPDHTEGAVVVIDVKRAVSAADGAVLKWVKAGCNPVRVVTAREQGQVYVTARGSDALLAFAETQLTGPGYDVLAARVPVGSSPTGLAVIDNGRKIVVTNSARFGGDAANRQSLFVIDTSRVVAGAAPLLGVLPAKGFPREIRSTPDGQTLLVTNFSAGTLEIVDLTRAPWVFSVLGAGRSETADNNDFAVQLSGRIFDGPILRWPPVCVAGDRS